MTPRRAAVVTGAGHGIGSAIALRLVRTGHLVLAADVDYAALCELGAAAAGLDGVLDLLRLDVSDPGSVAALAQSLPTSGVDVLVNNAGIGIERSFFETSPEEWRRVVDVNLTGPYLMARACWPYLRKPGAAIVNVSSIHGSRPLSRQSAYAAAKGGLENLTRAMALDAAPFGVRVNAVAPGFIRTRLWTEWLESEGAAASRHEREVRRIIPLGRPGEAEDVAEAVLWLSGPMSEYVTGTVLALDGGLGIQAFRRREDP